MFPSQSTGTHVHHHADEFFYVISGKGMVTVSGKQVPIEDGDFIFVSKGQEHRLVNSDTTKALEIIFLVDRPGLASEFREAHHEFGVKKKPITLEEINKITEKYGTTYKAID